MSWAGLSSADTPALQSDNVCKVTKRDELLPTLDEVIGLNLGRLIEQADMTQDQAARLARHFGLSWSRSTVGAVTSGTKGRLTLEEFVVLTGTMFPAAELLRGTGRVRLGSGSADLKDVRRVLGAAAHSGKAPPSRPNDLTAKDAAELVEGFTRMAAVQAAQGEAEQKAARKLGVTAQTLAESALGMWGRSLTAERDARVAASAPPDISTSSRQALRGRVTRELLKDLAPVLVRTRTKPRRKGT